MASHVLVWFEGDLIHGTVEDSATIIDLLRDEIGVVPGSTIYFNSLSAPTTFTHADSFNPLPAAADGLVYLINPTEAHAE